MKYGFGKYILSVEGKFFPPITDLSGTHRNEVRATILISTEESYDREDSMNEVEKDGQPHIPQEVENLPFQGRNLLKKRFKKKLIRTC